MKKYIKPTLQSIVLDNVNMIAASLTIDGGEGHVINDSDDILSKQENLNWRNDWDDKW